MRELPAGIEIALALLTVLAALFDVRDSRIPNWLTLSGLIAGVGLSAAYGIAWFSLEGLLLALIVYVPLWLLKAVGGGDAKLMAAVGSLVGPWNWLAVFVGAMLVSALIGVGRAMAARQVEALMSSTGKVVDNLLSGKSPASSDARLDVRNPAANRNPHALSVTIVSFALLVFLRTR